MAEIFYLKQHDTAPPIREILRKPPVAPATVGDPVDLTGCSVKFILKQQSSAGAPQVNAAGIIVGDPTLGLSEYDWITGDTSAFGDFNAEWEVTFPNGKKQTFPGFGYTTVHIDQDLDGS